jgi:hypothetical protein
LDADLCDGAGAVRDYSHTYVLLGDGTIIDPTLDQFYPGGRGNRAGDWTDSIWVKRDREEYGIEDLPSENPWFGEVAVIPVDHPFAQHYWSHRYPARAAGELGEAGHDYWLEQPAWYRALHKLDDLSPPSL